MADAHKEYEASLRSLSTSLHDFLHPTVSHDPSELSNRNTPSGRSHIRFDSARSESSHVRHSDVVINHSKHYPQPPSISNEHRPKSPDPPPLVQNFNFAPYQDPHHAAENPNFTPYPYPPMNYGMPPMASFFSFSMPSTGSNRISEPSAAQPKEPIMPPTMDPPSPDGSPWDFLNPFGSYDRYYDNYMPNTSFRKVREEEGIPELEEVKDESEYAISAQASKRIEKMKEEEDVDGKLKSVSARGSSVDQRSVRFSFEKEVSAKEMGREVEEVSVTPSRVFTNDLEIVSEIKYQFERAADVVKAMAEQLEAGKRPYHFKDSIRKG